MRLGQTIDDDAQRDIVKKQKALNPTIEILPPGKLPYSAKYPLYSSY